MLSHRCWSEETRRALEPNLHDWMFVCNFVDRYFYFRNFLFAKVIWWINYTDCTVRTSAVHRSTQLKSGNSFRVIFIRIELKKIHFHRYNMTVHHETPPKTVKKKSCLISSWFCIGNNLLFDLQHLIWTLSSLKKINSNSRVSFFAVSQLVWIGFLVTIHFKLFANYITQPYQIELLKIHF